MNLTSMLVLTTMFINVSNSLPKTSYMKMVDAWLLFNLLYPFIVVLLHTYMDTLRNEDDQEKDDDKSHDNKIQVELIHLAMSFSLFSLQVKSANLVSVDEKVELEAQKEFYKKVELEIGNKRKKKLEKMRRVNLIYLPLMALCFVVVFWYVGLKNAEVI